MAHTSPFHRRKWAGYISASRIFIAAVVLLIIPFGGEWRIPTPWDGEFGIPVTGVLVAAAIVFALLGIFFNGRVPFVLAVVCALLTIPFNGDRWHIGGVDDITLNAFILVFVLTALAPATDVLDGYFARTYPRMYEEDFFLWPGRNADGSVNVSDGKAENDMPNAFYFVLVPVAFVVRFFLEWINDWDSKMDSGWWLGVSLTLGGILLFGTLVFEWLKRTAVEEQARIAEAMQGWLAGLFYFLIPLGFAVLAFNHWSWVWQTVVYVVYVAAMLALFVLAQDRWIDRPESDYSEEDPDHPKRVRY